MMTVIVSDVFLFADRMRRKRRMSRRNDGRDEVRLQNKSTPQTAGQFFQLYPTNTVPQGHGNKDEEAVYWPSKEDEAEPISLTPLSQLTFAVMVIGDPTKTIYDFAGLHAYFQTEARTRKSLTLPTSRQNVPDICHRRLLVVSFHDDERALNGLGTHETILRHLGYIPAPLFTEDTLPFHRTLRNARNALLIQKGVTNNETYKAFLRNEEGQVMEEDRRLLAELHQYAMARTTNMHPSQRHQHADSFAQNGVGAYAFFRRVCKQEQAELEAVAFMEHKSRELNIELRSVNANADTSRNIQQTLAHIQRQMEAYNACLTAERELFAGRKNQYETRLNVIQQELELTAYNRQRDAATTNRMQGLMTEKRHIEEKLKWPPQVTTFPRVETSAPFIQWGIDVMQKRVAIIMAKRATDLRFQQEQLARSPQRQPIIPQPQPQAPVPQPPPRRVRIQELPLAPDIASQRQGPMAPNEQRTVAEYYAQQRAALQVQHNQAVSAQRRREEQAAEEQARQREQEQVRLATEERARQQAEEQARQQAAEEQARQREQEQVRLATEERARQQAEEQARQQAADRARRQEQEQVRLATEGQERQQAEDRARQQAPMRLAAEERARQQARARLAAMEQARQEAEEQARRKRAEEFARLSAKAQRQLEETAQFLAERHTQRQAEQQQQLSQAEHDAEFDALHALLIQPDPTQSSRPARAGLVGRVLGRVSYNPPARP